MTIEVEDGTGKTNAVSYVSAADATAYFAARGVTEWTEDLDEAAKEPALVRATAALDNWLKGQWYGKKKTQAQALAWPRTDVVDAEDFGVPDDEVPAAVVNACCEIALIESRGTPFLQQSVGANEYVTSETVGPVSQSFSNAAPTITYYPHIEAMLFGLADVNGVRIGMSVNLTTAEKEKLAGTSKSDPFNYPDYFNIIKWGP